MSWIQTHSGEAIDLLDPRPEKIHILDIAHSLANQARFNGHTRAFYSVAEHCVFMSLQVPRLFALEALMHDAAEAYVGDVPAPLKVLIGDRYRQIEQRFDHVIRQRFGVPTQGGPVVEADLRMLATEYKQLMGPSLRPWDNLDGVEPYDAKLFCWTPEEAKAVFLGRYRELQQPDLWG